MAVLDIIIAPDPRLKRRCDPVAAIDDNLRAFMDDLLETMYAANGIGLAAAQVGDGRRVVVIDLARDGEEARPMRFVNPEIVWVSDEDATYEEGCLSLPEHYADVVRPARVRVAYLDETGAAHEIEADGLLSTCLQHEIDHLDGVIFVDHVSSLKRNMILRKLTKMKKVAAA
ncbi:MAG: peptide deformylase [Rhodospirillales bacterium]